MACIHVYSNCRYILSKLLLPNFSCIYEVITMVYDGIFSKCDFPKLISVPGSISDMMLAYIWSMYSNHQPVKATENSRLASQTQKQYSGTYQMMSML